MRNFGIFLRASEHIVQEAAVFLITCYRAVFSPERGVLGVALKGIVPRDFLFTGCRFVPSCSAYARDAIRQYGLLHGLMVSSGRILRCHPWHAGGYDPVAGITKEL